MLIGKCSQYASGRRLADRSAFASCVRAVSAGSTLSGRGQASYLHGVHGDVDAAVQQRVVNLLGEQALAANVGQRLVQDLVAGGLDDDDLQGALLVELGEGLLRKGKGKGQLARWVRSREARANREGAPKRGAARLALQAGSPTGQTCSMLPLPRLP